MPRDLTGRWIKPPITEATIRRRAQRAEAQGGMCPECKLALPEDLAETEVDHIIPRARGGPNAPWNKRLVHFKCNRDKKARLTPEAMKLAVEYGVILVTPEERRGTVAAERRGRPAPSWLDAPPLYPTGCCWCGTPVIGPADCWIACDECYEAHDGPPPGLEESA